MQTITTKVIPATKTKPARMKATTSSGKSYTCSSDKFNNIEDAHSFAAKQLMCLLSWQGVMIAGDTKDGRVWVFFDTTVPMIDNNADKVIVNLNTSSDAFKTGNQSELKRIFQCEADAAALHDLHSNKIYDVNGNTVGYIKVL